MSGCVEPVLHRSSEGYLTPPWHTLIHGLQLVERSNIKSLGQQRGETRFDGVLSHLVDHEASCGDGCPRDRNEVERVLECRALLYTWLTRPS